jgi:hypothetical protein
MPCSLPYTRHREIRECCSANRYSPLLRTLPMCTCSVTMRFELTPFLSYLGLRTAFERASCMPPVVQVKNADINRTCLVRACALQKRGSNSRPFHFSHAPCSTLSRTSLHPTTKNRNTTRTTAYQRHSHPWKRRRKVQKDRSPKLPVIDLRPQHNQWYTGTACGILSNRRWFDSVAKLLDR